MNKKLNSKQGFLEVSIAVLVALAVLTFPFAFNLTFSLKATDADRTLTYTTNKLAWDTSAPINENGTINLEVFQSEYDGGTTSANGDNVVAPGVTNAKTVRILNASSTAIRYYATAYRTDSTPAKVTAFVAGGEDTNQHYYPEGVSETSVLFPVTQTGLVTASSSSDVSVGWQWTYEENKYQDSVDTYVGDTSVDNLTYDLFIVAEEVQVATVSFNTNGGSAVDEQVVEVGTTAKAPQNPTKEGYEFAGWYTDEACTQAFDFSTPVQADTTLYAKWTEIPVHYTVTFNSNGGSAVESQTVKAGEAAIKPENPTKDGYTFVAWFADEELKTPYIFETPVSADTTLWAAWIENVIPTPDPDDNTDDNFNFDKTSFNTDGFTWDLSSNRNKSTSGTSAKATGKTIPTTGDSGQMIVVFALVVVALVGVIVTAVADRRKQKRIGAADADEVHGA